MEAIRQNGKFILHSDDGTGMKMIFKNLTGKNFQGREYAWKTQARMTPGAKVDLTPEAKIGLTPLSKIKMTPVDIEPAGDFICIFGFRFGRRGIKPKKHEYKVKKHSPVSRIGNGNKKHQQCF